MCDKQAGVDAFSIRAVVWRQIRKEGYFYNSEGPIRFKNHEFWPLIKTFCESRFLVFFQGSYGQSSRTERSTSKNKARFSKRVPSPLAELKKNRYPSRLKKIPRFHQIELPHFRQRNTKQRSQQFKEHTDLKNITNLNDLMQN